MVIGIIGGGASGMAAALAAAENSSVQVHILERQARLGKKLLATGNGRCNLTNRNKTAYFGAEPAFAEAALNAYPVEDTLSWFEKMGLVTVSEDSGRVYPYSDQANSVVDVLRFALEKENITVHLACQVEKIVREDGKFVLSGSETFTCDKVIVACGGIAGTKLGGAMYGYRLLAKLGHKVSRLRPSLVQIRTAWKGIASLKGVRANCRARIFRDENLFAESCGEIQFTEMGVSGPVIFEISRDVCQGQGQWVCCLDFLPQMAEEALFTYLCRRRQTELPAGELLTGILHNRLGRVITQNAGISPERKIKDLADGELLQVCKTAKAFSVSLTEPLGMDSAQVTAGGVLTEDFDPETMESRLVPGLYACGEVLDIDGRCGGYNLQWAWSSGRLAGKSAGREQL